MSRFSSSKYIVSLSLTCLAGSVSAGPPVPYDDWVVNNGNIDTSVSCGAAGITCTVLSKDAGFLQEMVKTPDYSYIRYIVTDEAANTPDGPLKFSTETYVPFAENTSGMSQGIASKQIVRDALEGFESVAEVQRAMMRFSNPAMVSFNDPIPVTPVEDMFSIKLSTLINNTSGTPFSNSFDYTGYTAFAMGGPSSSPDTDVVIGRKIDMTQQVEIGTNPDLSAKEQIFVQRQRSGITGNVDIVNNPATLIWVPQQNSFGNYYYTIGNPLSPASSMTLGGVTVNWNDGDEVVTNWLAQTEMVTGDTAFAHQTVGNITSPAVASQVDLNAVMPVSPFDWDVATFGIAPTLP